MRRIRGFTLIELLVVISIVALLIALLLPAIKQSKAVALTTACMSNVRQIGIGTHSYISDNAGMFPAPRRGAYFTTHDIGLIYAGVLMGGDDQPGPWGIPELVPAEERPLAEYIPPESQAWRCPGDVNELEWYYRRPAWDAGTSSYTFNTLPTYIHRGIYGRRLDEIQQPSRLVLLGDWAWDSTRSDLASNDLIMFSEDASTWWHPQGFEQYKAVLGFVDGRSAYMHIEIQNPNTETYHRDPIGSPLGPVN